MKPTAAAATRRTTSHRERRGAMIVFVAALLIVLLIMTVFSVDVAYMQLVRTQLHAASDAAAKAGVEALVRTEDPDAAVAAAIAAAARNEVGGRPLVLTANDITLGRGEASASGNWKFKKNKTPYTAVRVDVAMNDDTAAGAVDLLFAKAIGSGKFTPEESSTAAHLDQEVVICVDRSHSMAFDLTGVSWSYPAGHGTSPHTVAFPPHPTLSRWAALVSASELFIETLNERDEKARVALVTWGSEIGTGSAEYSYTGLTEEAVTRELELTSDTIPSGNGLLAGLIGLIRRLFGGLLGKLDARTNNVMLGGTNMSAGIDESIDILTAGNVRPLANKTIVLMTDGQWNQGRDPELAAADAAAAGITIHTVSFLDGADSTTMENIASITGGKHFHATNRAELEAAFEELARTLPIVLTE